jgi:hypothetical protein
METKSEPNLKKCRRSNEKNIFKYKNPDGSIVERIFEHHWHCQEKDGHVGCTCDGDLKKKCNAIACHVRDGSTRLPDPITCMIFMDLFEDDKSLDDEMPSLIDTNENSSDNVIVKKTSTSFKSTTIFENDKKKVTLEGKADINGEKFEGKMEINDENSNDKIEIEKPKIHLSFMHHIDCLEKDGHVGCTCNNDVMSKCSVSGCPLSDGTRRESFQFSEENRIITKMLNEKELKLINAAKNGELETVKSLLQSAESLNDISKNSKEEQD